MKNIIHWKYQKNMVKPEIVAQIKSQEKSFKYTRPNKAVFRWHFNTKLAQYSDTYNTLSSRVTVVHKAKLLRSIQDYYGDPPHLQCSLLQFC